MGYIPRSVPPAQSFLQNRSCQPLYVVTSRDVLQDVFHGGHHIQLLLPLVL